MAYESIAPIPSPLRAYSDPQLRALERVWTDRREQLERTSSVEHVLEHLHREWAIETGLIERVYEHDRGITRTLIEKGIDASLLLHAGQPAEQAHRAVAMMRDHKTVVDGLFSFVKSEQQLTHHYIRSLHQQLVAHQESCRAIDSQGNVRDVPLLRGKYKEQPNNVTLPDGTMFEFCPPERTQDEMEQLLGLYAGYSDGGVRPEVLAAWLHHRFTQIHPFMDGNGRVVRTLASIVFLRAGGVPLVVRQSDAPDYYKLLATADAGDLTRLVEFFAKRQRDLLLQLLDMDPPVDEQATIADIVQAVVSGIDGRDQPDPPFRKAIEISVRLQQDIEAKFNDNAELIEARIRQVNSKWNARVRQDKRLDPDLRAMLIVALAELDEPHSIDWAGFSRLFTLTIKTENEIEIAIALYARHARFRGVISGLGLVVERDGSGDITTMTQLESPGVFSFTYADEPGAASDRFAAWLDDVLRHGVTRWGELAKLRRPTTPAPPS